jgi:hypothetical protein
MNLTKLFIGIIASADTCVYDCANQDNGHDSRHASYIFFSVLIAALMIARFE